ncbi:MAG: Fur-regulated basic protein FbpA [Bacteroidetes bacterium]|nr:MAG: Fur-regulated basic protein FbpA [Bacteroidota bacterium]
MEHLLKSNIQQKRQYLIEELIKSGIYKKNNKHLYEWTLSDLEKEYQSMETLSLQRGKSTTL